MFGFAIDLRITQACCVSRPPKTLEDTLTVFVWVGGKAEQWDVRRTVMVPVFGVEVAGRRE